MNKPKCLTSALCIDTVTYGLVVDEQDFLNRLDKMTEQAFHWCKFQISTDERNKTNVFKRVLW